MNIEKAQLIFLFNGLLFISIMLSNQVGESFYLFCLIGLLLNIFLFLKRHTFLLRSENKSSKSSRIPNSLEQNEIMSDLEREMVHRREVKKLNKN
tara:strand:+ start:11143 stop:11427 length:285 start_codon:yes stop_codon:yes gene_type:complete